ncbi:hypothetical protein AB0A77_02160 [Streptomyces varsoviensis]|uniref:hypothetical protein n=1 Tax=Streptomyces varsoviensis TaxID=67373 RepID=UPI0033C0CF49
MSLTRRDLQYDAAVRRVWSTVVGRVGRSWTDLGSWRNDDVKAFQKAALPLLQGGQRQVASLTATYLEQLYKEITDEKVRVDLDFDAVTGAALRGVDPADVYERPFKEVWTALSVGEPLEVAVERGGRRLESIAKTDLQLTRTHTAREVADEMPGVTYTVREPVGEYNCALCLIASTQRYHKRKLLPIHPGCDCLVKLVKADYDPGQVIDEDKLQRIHDAVEAALGTHDRGGRAVDYRKIIVQHEHGEIGPVLGYRNQRFTGPDDLGNGNEPRRPGSSPGEPPRARISSGTREYIDEVRDSLPTTSQEWYTARHDWIPPENSGTGQGRWELSYRRDENGSLLPPERYERYLDSVLGVGRDLQWELHSIMDSDDELRRLRENFQALQAVPNPTAEELETARRAIARREASFVRTLLADVRPFGGSTPIIVGDPSEIGGDLGHAPGNWKEQLHEAFSHFPEAWHALTQDATLHVVGQERAFYSRSYRGRPDFMALSLHDYRGYDGAFTDGATEVAAHELGHRMEQYVPGLCELEYTLVRRRAMRDGVLSPPRNMADLNPHYNRDAQEMTYEDDWPNAYTGKTYERHYAIDPAHAPSELFQVGLQDLFGRGTTKYGDEELEAFMLAILVLL